MDKIVYLYGSARDASTREVRRSHFPREMQIRIGPWIIRPSRRTAVDFERLAPYAADLLSKVQSGVIQVQRADTSILSVEEISAGFKSLAAPNYDTMPLGELHALLRVENPDPAAQAALARRTAESSAPPVAAAPPPPPPPPPPAAPEPEPEVPAVLEAPQRETDPAPADDSRESRLPEGWRMLTNRELTALCSDLGIPMPETVTKKNLVAAVESWLGGS